jgi:hypothetical protein
MAGHFTFQPGSSASSPLAGLLIIGSAHALLLQEIADHDHALALIGAQTNVRRLPVTNFSPDDG